MFRSNRRNNKSKQLANKPIFYSALPLRFEELESRLAPATFTWSGLGTDSNWSTGNNWLGNVAPTGTIAESDDLVFPSSVTKLTAINDLANPILNSISISGSAYTLSGLPITLGLPVISSGSFNVNAGSTGSIVSLNMSLGAASGSDQTFSINNGADLTVSGQISGVTGSTLTRDGAGTLILTNDNSGFTGSIRANNNSGTIIAKNAKALGDTSSPTIIGSGSSLRIDTVGTISEPIILNGGGVNNLGALINDAGNNIWTGSVLLDSDTTLGSTAGVLSIVTPITDSSTGHNLVKEGAGEIQFDSPSGNTYRGTTTVNNGILTLGNAFALGASGLPSNGTIVNQTLTGRGQIRLGDAAGSGFTIQDESLTLNGNGLDGLGSLSNRVGDNIWAGPITLGSPFPNGFDVTVGAKANTNMTLSGVISSPNIIAPATGATSAFIKQDSGRVILNNANTYTGTTFVAGGTLNIRDSKSLGSTSAGTTVASGATLELEVEASSSTPRFDAQGRDTWNDSVTGDPNKLLIGESFTISGRGFGGVGALRNVSGVNQIKSTITLNSAEAAIGSEPDTRSGHPTPDITYFTSDYSLTAGNTITGGNNTNFVKRGAGHLILATANSYTGKTLIEQGWVTIQNTNSLGGRLTAVSDTIQPGTVVSSGAALHILPLMTGKSTMTIPENITLAGSGPAHPYAFINQKGALVNLGGNNVLTGDISLSNVAGIGVEQLDTLTPSDLIVTGSTFDTNAATAPGGIVKYGSKKLTLQADGTYSGSTTVAEGTLRVQHDTALGELSSGTFLTNQSFTTTDTIVAPAAILELSNSVAKLNGGIAAGVQITNERLTLNTPGQQVTVAGRTGTFQLNYGGQVTNDIPITATALTVQNELNNLSTIATDVGTVTVTKNGSLFTVFFGTVQSGNAQPLTATTKDGAEVTISGGNASLVNVTDDNTWRGSVVLASSTRIDVSSDSRLSILGSITDTANPAANGSDLVKRGSGDILLAGTNTYRGLTNLDEGITTIANNSALGAATQGTVVSTAAQLEIQGNLTIAGEALTLIGTGPGTVPNVQSRWLNVGAGPINNSQIPRNLASTGRTTSVAVDPTDNNVIYIATSGGGAWKTKNGGYTWLPLFDNTLNSVMHGGAIALAPSDPKTVYFATGEANNSGDSYSGTGVYKSTDAGQTWSLVTSASGTSNPLYGQAISKIIINPTLSNVFYVASSTLASVNGVPAGRPGVWRFDGTNYFNMTAAVSTNRNSVFGQAPFGDPANVGNFGPPKTPGPDDDYRLEFPQVYATWSDLVYVQQTGTLYAALGDALGATSNANTFFQNAIFYTSDIGSTTPRWYVGTPGTTPDNRASSYPVNTTAPYVQRNYNIKIAAAYSAAAGKTTVYGLNIDPNTYGVLDIAKSTDSAQTWTATGAPPNFVGNQGFYDNPMLAFDPNTLYAGGQGALVRTTDGGTTWVDISVDAAGNGPHVDYHSLSTDAVGNLYATNDGGIWKFDTTSRWRNLNGNLRITTFKGVDSHPTDFNIAMGGSQDNGTELFNGSSAWTHVDDGDGGQVRYNQKNPLIAYHVLNGFLRKTVDGGQTWSTVSSLASPTSGLYFPFLVDSVNTSRVLVGGDTAITANRLQESNNDGASWIKLNVPNAVRALAVAVYQGTFLADPSFTQVVDRQANTYDPDTIYTTNGSIVTVTKNHGLSWVNRPVFDPTDSGTGSSPIVDLAVDPTNRDTIYALRSNTYGTVDNNRVYKSTDAGRTWKNITYNLPYVPNWRIIIDPRNGALYIGNDNGVMTLPSGGTSWSTFGTGMPRVQVKDLVLNQALNTLTAGTYGRSMFQLFLTNYQASSGSLRISSGTSVWTGPVTLVGDTTISAAGTQALQNGISAATLNIVGPIVDSPASGNFVLIKKGQGTLTLSGNNTYSGQTQVQEGVLQANNSHALGTASPTGNTVVSSGAALELRSDLELEPVTISGNGYQFNSHYTGALRNVSNNNTYTGPLTLGTNTTIGVDSGTQLRIGGSPSLLGTGTVTDGTATFGFIKELPGTLVLGGPSTYDGLTTVQQGMLRVEDADALGTPGQGTIVIDGAQMQISRNAVTLLPTIIASEPLTLSGTGINNTGALYNTRGNTDLTGTNDNIWRGPITFDKLPNSFPTTVPASQIAIGVADQQDTLTLDTVISENVANGSFGLIKVGAGHLTLTKANTYSGLTNINAGYVRIQNANALGTISQGTIVAAGGSLEIDGDPTNIGNSLLVSELLTLNGDGQSNQGAIINVSGNNTYLGQITLGSSTSLSALANTTLTIPTALQESAPLPVPSPRLRKTGMGTVVFPVANNYYGKTIIDNGVLRISNAQALGVARNEQQAIQLIGTTGTFTLSFNGSTTASLPYNTTAAQVQAALNALASIAGVGGSVTVTSVINAGSTTFTVTFGGSLANSNQPTIFAASVNGTTTTVTVMQDGAEGTTVLSGGTLQLQGGINFDNESVTITGSGYQNQGALNNYQGNNTWGKVLTLGGNASIGVTNSPDTLNFVVPITDNGSGFSLYQVGVGTVQFSNTTDNQYTGTTFVQSGTLLLNQSTGIAIVGPLVIGDTASPPAKVSETKSNQIANLSTVTVNSDGTFDLNGLTDIISDLTINGGNVLLQNNGNLTTGILTMTGGLLAGGTNSMLSSQAATIKNNASVVLGASSSFTTNGQPLTMTSNGTISMTSGTLTTGNANLTDSNITGNPDWTSGVTKLNNSGATVNSLTALDTTLTNSSNVQVVANSSTNKLNITTGSQFSVGSGATLTAADVTIADANSSLLLNANTTLNSTSISVTGTAALSALDGVTVTNTGTLSANVSTIDFGNSATLKAASTTLTSSKLSTALTPNMTFGTLSMSSNSVLTLGSNGSATTNDLSMTNSNLWVGDNATLTSQNITLTASTITLGSPTGSGASHVVKGDIAVNAATSSAIVEGTGTLSLPGTNQSITVADGSTDQDFVVSAQLSGSGIKSGVGRMVLSYPAIDPVALVVNNGDLEVDSQVTSVKLAATTSSLSGTGHVGSMLTPTAGTVTPGVSYATSTVGIMQATSAVWTTQTTFAVDLSNSSTANATPGTDYDQLQLTGSIDLGGATLTGTYGTGIKLLDQFTIISAAGGVTGRFAEPYGPDVVFIQGQKFAVDYSDPTKVILQKIESVVLVTFTSSANPSSLNQSVTFTLTATPEPGAIFVKTSGTVTFVIDGVVLVPDVDIGATNQATFTTTTLAGGSHTIEAQYHGDPINFVPPQTLSIKQNVEVPSIDPVVVIPPVFSPNNSPGILDTVTTMSAVNSVNSTTTWDVTINDSSNAVVRTISGTGVISGNSFPINPIWDGKDSSGAYVADGIYQVSASFTDLYGNTATTSQVPVTVDNTNPVLGTISISTPVIAPGTTATAAKSVTINSTVSDTNFANWMLSIVDSTNTTVRFVTATSTTVGYVWDGTDPSGAIVPDGDYTITIIVNDLAGNTTTSTRTVTVLTQAPAITLTSPSSIVYGQGNTVIATVSVANPAVTTLLDGTLVQFYSQSSPIGSPVPLSLVGGEYQATLTSGGLSVGSYTLTASYLGSVNFLGATSSQVTLQVTPKPITVTAVDQTKLYGFAVPALTYTTNDLVRGDTMADVFTGSLTTTATLSSPLGSYAITQGTLTTNANYTMTFLNGILTVIPATLTVTADNSTKLYGAAVPTLTYTATGFGPGDTASSVLSGSLATTATPLTAAGTQVAITQGTLKANPNYTLQFVNGTLTVTQATLTVTADSVVKTYGAAIPIFTYSVTGLANNETPSQVLTGGLSTSAMSSSPVGTYAITRGNLTANSNYSLVFNNGNLTISPADLVVTIDSHSKVYGEANPPLSYVVAGLVNSDTVNSVFSGSFATTATQFTGIGTYPISQGTFTASTNYVLSVVNGTLTVTPAPITITVSSLTQTYGAVVPTLTYAINGLVGTDTAVQAVTGSLATTATSGSNVGVYPITQASLAPTANYSLATFTPNQITIVPAPLTIVANDLTIPFSSTAPTLTYNVAGMVNGDTQAVVTGSLATPYVPGTLTGTYPINQGTVAPNVNYYVTSYQAGTLRVLPHTELVGTTQFAVGADSGRSDVNFYNPDGTLRFTSSTIPGTDKGARVASAEFNGDGIADLVVASGPGTKNLVTVLNGITQEVLFQIQPFEDAYTGGVNVSAGDVTGDGIADLVISPDNGGGPRVRIFNGQTFTQIADFFGIEDDNFRGGVRTAVGDIDGDGISDLVVAAGYGGGPRVAGFNGKSLGSTPVKLFSDFFAFEPELRNGAYVAAGDLNGNGFADVITGGGPGGGPRVRAFDGRDLIREPAGYETPIANFFAGNINSRDGVRVTAKDLDNDGQADLITGAGAGDGNKVTAYSGRTIISTPATLTPVMQFDPFQDFTGGVYVG